jgi:fumarylacetoacetase
VPSTLLDIELEVGFLVGGPPTARIEPDHADRHVFGAVLLNDWSARDIQAYEYQPLGPHLAKSFATTISPWVVTMDALRPFLVEPPEQDPVPDPYLRAALPWGLDLELRVALNGTEICATNFASMYWTFAQQLAHLSVNGAAAGAGDLFGSGTVSGPTATERGSLLERTWRGAEPLVLADGSTRSFLEDGDTVSITGWCGDGDRPRVGFGAATGTIVPTPPRPDRGETT